MNYTGVPHNLSLISPFGLRLGRGATAAVQLVFGSVGLGGNIVLAAGVLTHPPLRSKNTLLLAMLSISDAGACLFSFLCGIRNGVIAGLGWAEVSVWQCYVYQDAPRAFFLFAGVILILACSLDRLLMMKRPLQYASLSTERYVAGWVVAAALFAGASCLVQGLNLQREYTALDFCDGTFIYNLQVDMFMTAVHAPLSLLIVLVNTTSIFFVKAVLQAELKGKDEQRRKRFQVYTVSWLGLIGAASVENFGFPIEPGAPVRPVHFWVIVTMALMFHLNNSTNFFIYYWRNAEFRRAFRRVARLPLNDVGSTTAAGPASVNLTVAPKRAF